jgi:hypothetical protein
MYDPATHDRDGKPAGTVFARRGKSGRDSDDGLTGGRPRNRDAR